MCCEATDDKMDATAEERSLLDSILRTSSSGTSSGTTLGLMTFADFWPNATLPPTPPAAPAGVAGCHPAASLPFAMPASLTFAQQQDRRPVTGDSGPQLPPGAASQQGPTKEEAATNEPKPKPKRNVKHRPGPSSIEENWATVEDKRRAQNRRHAAASRQRKVDALHDASAEGSRYKKENDLLAVKLRETSAELEYVLECIEGLPVEHRDAIISKHLAFSASCGAANSALQGQDLLKK